MEWDKGKQYWKTHSYIQPKLIFTCRKGECEGKKCYEQKAKYVCIYVLYVFSFDSPTKCTAPDWLVGISVFTFCLVWFDFLRWVYGKHLCDFLTIFSLFCEAIVRAYVYTLRSFFVCCRSTYIKFNRITVGDVFVLCVCGKIKCEANHTQIWRYQTMSCQIHTTNRKYFMTGNGAQCECECKCVSVDQLYDCFRHIFIKLH